MYDFQMNVPKGLYPPVVVLKAAYTFLDAAYLHIEETDRDWIVHMSAKQDGEQASNLARAWENELIAQAVREQVYQRTHTLREILMARAMTSTVIDREDPIRKLEAEEMDVPESELRDILTDWFERYGQ